MIDLARHSNAKVMQNIISTKSITSHMDYSITKGLAQFLSAKQKAKSPKEEESFKKLKYLVIQGDKSFVMGAYLEAEKAYREALTQAKLLGENKLIASCYNLIGGSLGYQGRHEEGLRYFDKAITLYARFVAAWWNKVIALGKLQKDEEALFCLDRILALGAKDDDAWHVKGTILYNLQRYENALQSFNKSLELYPNSGIAWLNKGLTLLRLQRFTEATTAFEQAYNFPETLGNSKAELYAGWTWALLLGALQAQLSKDLESVEYWADFWGDVMERAKEDGLDSVMSDRMSSFKAKLPPNELKAFSKIERKLHRMENPLYRLRALTIAISKKWPKGLSAVEAIREDRR